jgi:hypothetical protein
VTVAAAAAASTLLLNSIATEATVVEQAATTIAVLLSTTEQSPLEESPEEEVVLPVPTVDLTQISVTIPIENHDCLGLQQTLDQLDHCLWKLEKSLSTTNKSNLMTGSPGFWSRELVHGWRSSEEMDLYETWCTTDSRDDSCLLPNLDTALRVYRAVRDSIAQRLDYLQSNVNDNKTVCMCYSVWNHGNALSLIINQKLEQVSNQ